MKDLNKILVVTTYLPGYGSYINYSINNIVYKQFPYKIGSIVFFRQDGDTIKKLFMQHLTSDNVDECFRSMTFKVPQKTLKVKTKITGLKSKADDIFYYKDTSISEECYSLYINAELIHLSKANIIKEPRKSEGKLKLQGYNYCLKFKWSSDIGTFTKRVLYDTEHYNILIRIAKDRAYDYYKNHGYQYLHDIDVEIAMLQTLKKTLEEAMQIWQEYSDAQIYEYLKTREIIKTIEEKI